MNNRDKSLEPRINSEMTVLDVVATYKNTLLVFKKYDAIAGECICCNSLFDTLFSVARKHDFDLPVFLKNLENAAYD